MLLSKNFVLIINFFLLILNILQTFANFHNIKDSFTEKWIVFIFIERSFFLINHDRSSLMLRILALRIIAFGNWLRNILAYIWRLSSLWRLILAFTSRRFLISRRLPTAWLDRLAWYLCSMSTDLFLSQALLFFNFL